MSDIKRDEKGRPVAEDGYPMGGLATVAEVVAATGLSRTSLYDMIQAGELPVRRIGRCVRISWEIVRETFLSPV